MMHDGNLIQSGSVGVGDLWGAINAAVVNDQNPARELHPLKRGQYVVHHMREVVFFVVCGEHDTPLGMGTGKREQGRGSRG